MTVFPIPTQLFINGEYTDSASPERFPIYNPTNDSLITDKLQFAVEEDVNKAVKSAQIAFRSAAWTITAKERGRLLHQIAQVLRENKDELAWLDRIAMGKPVKAGLGEIQMAADLFEYYAGWADKHAGESFPADDGFLKIVQHEPLGVCAGILPWNGPIGLIAFKCGPALATGNVMILKPSEKTPFSALRFASLVSSILPPGVLQVLTGAGATGDLLARHPHIRKISFTGSGPTGKKIQRAAAETNLKRVTLELGGKSPAGIFEDCNLENAVQWATTAITQNSGQVCIAASRLYVQESIAEKFTEAFVKSMKAAAERVGDPDNEETGLGPLADKAQLARVESFFADGETQILVGGKRRGDTGCFFEPTVLYNPDSQANVYKNEIFGPVTCLRTFKTEEEFLEMANDTEYGLMAAVFTKDVSRAMRISALLESGSVGINCVSMINQQVPFGGYKQSGIGRELGIHGLESYTETKTIYLNLNC
ncbi:aldehyde dehydrogenase [Penicillium macrosclerotiorum]|uniref:aldehyde dehydrogenase n=1 Tax=Penicillium macrosclerotiorum TaxID=303699 RepID=UPI0025466A2E|nr:aldehyde dehydrogenase [Penicillium macrosclerotiorum]KAJ5683535.1 aldehyde dehydrogenase [Penicillium macrosclerotiorum]